MVKQIESWNQETPSQVESLHNQALSAAPAQQDPETGSSIPSELYQRLGLAMPRWLFWILTIVLGTTLSGLLVSSLALWTPLWSDMSLSEEEITWSSKDGEDAVLPGDLLSNISQYQLTKPMNILVLGIEPVPGTVDGTPESFAGKSDTMLLIRLNPDNKTLRVLSIPRDTMISIPEQGLNKVSQANAQGGPVLAARVVSRSLSNAPIHRHIRISTGGLQQLVDQLGGVEVFVPKRMVYFDSAQRLSINLVSGWQTLNGQQAQEFVRFREQETGDLARVQRQQALLLGLRDRLNSPTVIPRLPQLSRLMLKYFDTNLKLEEMMAVVNFISNVERDDFQMTLLPGTFSRLSADPDSYWLNLTGKADLLRDYVGVDNAGLNPDRRSLNSMRIAVQNATSNPELAIEVIANLNSQGFTNVYAIEDWNDARAESQIIAQKGDRQAAEELQQLLKNGHVSVAATGDIESDLTIRIGRDWK